MSFGPWMLKVFAALAKFKFLRGTALRCLSATRPSGKLNAGSSLTTRSCSSELTEHLTPNNHQHCGRRCDDPGEDPRLRAGQTAASGRCKGGRNATLLEQFRAGAPTLLRAAE